MSTGAPGKLVLLALLALALGLAGNLAEPVKPARLLELEPAEREQRVAVGRPVRFKCLVENIGEHKVHWFHKQRRLLLAIGNKTTAWKERVQVSSHADSVFFLHLDSVQLTDKVS